WEALRPWRGLRAPGRLGAVDPAELREKADSMPRDEILDSYPIATGPDEILAVYRPLVTELEADTVVMQMTALDQEALIEMLGAEVLPRLRLNS
ncbi:MAG: LLM class F420-dependent oxidoreductase, partial [Acidimicrobiia bacterium]